MAKISEIPALQHLSTQAIKMGERVINAGDLFYVSGSDYYSTCGFQLAGGNLAANSVQQCFLTEIGSSGQGFSSLAAFTENETNNTSGRRMPVNEAYIAWACGYELYSTASIDSLAPVPIRRAVDLDKLIRNIRWTYQRGTGPENVIAHLCEWPAANGVGLEAGGISTAVTATTVAINGIPTNGSLLCSKGVFSPYMVLPPLQDIYFRLRVGTGISLSADWNSELAQFSGTEVIAVRMRFKGLRVSTQNPG